MRWLVTPLLGVLAALALFWLMQYMISVPESHESTGASLIEAVEVVEVEKEEPPPPDEIPQLPEAAPPPPGAPSPLARPSVPSPAAIAAPAIGVGDIGLPMNLPSGGGSLTGKGFGGFAGRGRGGGDGYGRGQGFEGKELVPLSTARPQMPEWACRQHIKGWVEAVFTVMPNGRVQNVKIIDASPRGVYEAAAIESISNWIYESHSRAREVKQRVDMDPAECVYNWR